MPIPLACYLLREDGEWYELGSVPEWRLSFGVFPGPSDGSVWLRWGRGKRLRFITELDPEIEPGVKPAPISGSITSK